MYSTASIGPSHMENPMRISQALPSKWRFTTFHYTITSFHCLPIFFFIRQARSQEFFKAREVSWNLGSLINISANKNSNNNNNNIYFSANMTSSKNYIFLYINTTMSYNKYNVASFVASGTSWMRPE